MAEELPAHLERQTLSPFHELIGIRVTDWREGYARIECRLGPQHANRSGIAHGGVMLSLLDQAGAFAGLFCDVPGHRRAAVTLDLDCRFTGQAPIGALLIAEGRLATAGRTIFFARSEVRCADGRLIAFGASTHRYLAGSGDPRGVPVEKLAGG
ncbi:MAG: PaaI family thioesterase [Rhodovarius sp.]|nr:PaaI family thioesterase [Rhodovarius sp.]